MRRLGSLSIDRFDLVAASVGALICLMAVWVHMQAFPNVSPFDEATHFDYVLSLQSGELPKLGTPYDQRVLSEWSCRGGYTTRIVLPPCDSPTFDYSLYPARGVQRNPTGPLYYAIVALVSKPIVAITGMSALGAARLVGSVFLWATSLCVVAAAQFLGVSKRFAWLFTIPIFLGMPLVMHAVSTVNSDAGTLLVGGVALLLATWPDPIGRRFWYGAFALAVGSALTKQTALFPLGMLTIALVLRSLAGGGTRAEKNWRSAAAVALCVAAVVVLGVWTVVVQERTVEGYEDPIGMGNTVTVEGHPIDEALTGLTENLPPANSGYIPPSLRTPFQPIMVGLFGVAFLGGVGFGLAAGDVRIRSLAWGLIAGSLASAAMIQAYLAFAEDRFFRVPNPRYAIGLVPASVAIAAVLFGSRRELRVVGLSLSALAFVAGVASVHT